MLHHVARAVSKNTETMTVHLLGQDIPTVPISVPTPPKKASQSLLLAIGPSGQLARIQTDRSIEEIATYRIRSHCVATPREMPENQISGAVNRRVVGSSPT